MADFNLTNISGSYSLNGNGQLSVGGTYTAPASEGGTGTYTGGYMIGGFKDGSISFDVSSVDNACRGDGGWAMSAAGQRSCKIDLTLNKLEEDEGQVGIRDFLVSARADFQNKAIALAYTSTAGTTTSGFAGLFVITSYSEKQSGGGDSDATAVEVSISLASYSAISKITAIGSAT